MEILHFFGGGVRGAWIYNQSKPLSTPCITFWAFDVRSYGFCLSNVYWHLSGFDMGAEHHVSRLGRCQLPAFPTVGIYEWTAWQGLCVNTEVLYNCWHFPKAGCHSAFYLHIQDHTGSLPIQSKHKTYMIMKKNFAAKIIIITIWAPKGEFPCWAVSWGPSRVFFLAILFCLYLGK